MPLLPRGAQLWLTKSQDPALSFFGPQPWSFLVRNHQNGTLLFGAARGAYGPLSSPVGVDQLKAICTTAAQDPCALGATVTYASGVVEGDTPVVVRDDEPATITLGGVGYDVRLSAEVESASGVTGTCADYYPTSIVGIDIKAQNLTDLTAGLSAGAPPACGEGNDPNRTSYFTIYDASVSSVFNGPVSYKGPDTNSTGGYDFDIPGLPAQAGNPAPILYVAGAGEILPEPSVGQQFWLSYQGFNLQALLQAEQGPVVLAQYSGSPQAGAAAQLASLLGITVTVEQECMYSSSLYLWDVVFGTDPPVRVASGTIGTLNIGGQIYNAWVWGETNLSITIYPSN